MLFIFIRRLELKPNRDIKQIVLSLTRHIANAMLQAGVLCHSFACFNA